MVTGSNLQRRLFKSSESILNSSTETLVLTEWAQRAEKQLYHGLFLIFFLQHFGNLIFGTWILFPLFFNLDLHLGKIIDEEYVCHPSLFWFTFLTLLLEYGMILIFTISFFNFVPKDAYKFQKSLDNFN